jgi:hypothetical protein
LLVEFSMKAEDIENYLSQLRQELLTRIHPRTQDICRTR